ncbi:MAG: response regulator [Edaphobacter sp.]
MDDERIIATTLEAILRCTGYEAKAACSAEEAIEVIAGWQPAFAIVDVVLPLLNGIELSKLLRAQIPDCGILLISGQTCTGELLEQAEREGYKFEVLAKPVHPSVLLEKTAEMLAHRRDQPVELLLDQTGPSAAVQASITTQGSQRAPETPALSRRLQ